MEPNQVNAQPAQKKVGPIIATVVAIVAIIAIVVYVLASRSGDDANMASSTPETVAPVTGTSTDVQSLQSDLDAATEGIDSQNF